ncbi:hypothetical protein LINPERHAP1_LOCUS24331 [Linum perenne]
MSDAPGIIEARELIHVNSDIRDKRVVPASIHNKPLLLSYHSWEKHQPLIPNRGSLSNYFPLAIRIQSLEMELRDSLSHVDRLLNSKHVERYQATKVDV